MPLSWEALRAWWSGTPPAPPDEVVLRRLALVSRDTSLAGEIPPAALTSGAGGAAPVVLPRRRVAAGLVSIAVASAALTGVVVWRARPVAVPAAAGRPAFGSAVSASPGGYVVVDVVGGVRRPGIVRLPAGSRVMDAVRAAGGLRPGVVPGVNLAKRLVDGEQVVVGVATGAGGAPAAPDAPARLDLNAATAEQLEELPGVGPVLARRIVDWRDAHGRFTTVEQLREVSGIGERTFEALRDLVVV